MKDMGDTTIDELVYETKTQGSAIGLQGFTTPEHWKFAVIVVVASPGNEAAMELVKEFHLKMRSIVKSMIIENF